MNFFESQDNARKYTARLVIFFSLAVISLVILTNLLVMATLGYLNSQEPTVSNLQQHFDWQTFWTIGAGVVIVITAASLYKIMSLSRGGASVAEMLGAELITDSHGDLSKRKVLNIVEEMAIASGTPVPPVYLLTNEEGINAFAAGLTPSDAVIGVTRGCIDKLDRDELQGVIAHEFSHIFNGDMRINIRLIGLLHGILILGIIGYYILRSGAHSGRRSSKNNAGGFMALGLGLLVIGYAGTFFGNLIKAAVNRQREYLADASAVQFTRNPAGIAGALKQIGASQSGSQIENPHGAEISHALFSEGLSRFSSLFATHPPLGQRIRRIEPNWDGSFPEPLEHAAETQQAETTVTTAEKVFTGIAAATAVMATSGEKDVTRHIGQTDPEHLAYARQLLANLPDEFIAAVHEPYGARALMYLLLLNRQEDIRQQQLAHLQSASDDGVYEATLKLTTTRDIEIQERLPLIELALPTLRQLSLHQYQRFKANINTLIEADNKVNLFEWSLRKILFQHLDAVHVRIPPLRPKYSHFKQVSEACSLLLSMLLYTDKAGAIDAPTVISEAADILGYREIHLVQKNEISLPGLNTALDKLKLLKPLLKPRLLKACATCITADKKISPLETELFRAIADTLDCPMPPLLLDED